MHISAGSCSCPTLSTRSKTGKASSTRSLHATCACRYDEAALGIAAEIEPELTDFTKVPPLWQCPCGKLGLSSDRDLLLFREPAIPIPNSERRAFRSCQPLFDVPSTPEVGASLRLGARHWQSPLGGYHLHGISVTVQFMLFCQLL